VEAAGITAAPGTSASSPSSAPPPPSSPEAAQIVGIYHAREHRRDLARILEFMLGEREQD